MIGAYIGITRPELEALFSLVTFKNAMLPMALAMADEDEDGHPVLIIDRLVIDRNAPSFDAPLSDAKYGGTVRSRYPLPWTTGATVDTAQVFAWLRNRALRDVMLHELDEWLHIDGVRVFDPHADEEATAYEGDESRGEG